MVVNTLGLVFLGLRLDGFSTINLKLLDLELIVSAIYSLSRLNKLTNPRKMNRVLYNLYLFSHFLQRLVNLKNYDDRLYVNVDDLAV